MLSSILEVIVALLTAGGANAGTATAIAGTDNGAQLDPNG